MGVRKSSVIKGNNNNVINEIKEDGALSHSLEMTSQTALGLMKIINDLRRKLTRIENDYRELKISYAALMEAFKDRETEIDGQARRAINDIH